jgi:hypothetical protein
VRNPGTITAALVLGRDGILDFVLAKGALAAGGSWHSLSFDSFPLFHNEAVVSSLFGVINDVLFNESINGLDFDDNRTRHVEHCICDGEKKNAPGVSRRATQTERWRRS